MSEVVLRMAELEEDAEEQSGHFSGMQAMQMSCSIVPGAEGTPDSSRHLPNDFGYINEHIIPIVRSHLLGVCDANDRIYL